MIPKNTLVLFTINYPYKGGETFLHNEMPYLSQKFETIIVIPQLRNESLYFTVPDNVNVDSFEFQKRVKVKYLIKKYWKLIIKWWFSEFYKSPHRLKYIKEINWNYNRFMGLLETANRLLEFGSGRSVDVYYAYWFNEWATILALAKDMGLEGRIITRAHGYDFDEAQQSRGYHPFRYTEVQKMDAVYQVSLYGLNYMKRQFPSLKNLVLSRLGTKDFGNGPLGSGEIYRIVSVSNFVPLKRILLIARTLSELHVKYHWIHFGDGPERLNTERMVGEILPTGCYTFQGYTDNDELMKYYRTEPVDLFINMSVLEGLPVSMMEAISFGIPVVGCRVCGIPELVNSETGVLLDEDCSPSDAAMEIESFLKLKSRDLKFRSGVRKIWETNFSGDLNYSTFPV